MPFGIKDVQFVQFPEGQTESRIRGLQNRIGINYMEFITRVDGALTALNADDPLITSLTYNTTRDSIDAPGTSDKVWQRSAEYTPGRPQRGQLGRGHYLPLYYYEIDLGFTDRGLAVMPVERFEDELSTTVQAVARGRRADVLGRLFNPNSVPLDDDGNGSSPGFAGSGVGPDAFVGVLPNSQTTAADYTHYFQMADTDEAIDAGIKAMLANLNLWNRGPYDLLASQEMTERIMSITGDDSKFVTAGSTLIRPGEAQSTAMVDANIHLGVYAGWIRVLYPETQLEGMSFAIFKSHGRGSQLNPLARRYDPLYGENAYVDDRRLTPLTEAMILQTYGIGVSNRTGAALASVGGEEGVYTPPAIYR